MADWETDWSGDVLERIVALLFALANLADLAAGLSFSHRRQVLGILSRGEAEARAFLVGISTGAPATADAPAPAGDASHLAARLRMLALLLCAMLAQATTPGAAGPRACRPLHEMPGPAVRRPGASALPAFDTS